MGTRLSELPRATSAGHPSLDAMMEEVAALRDELFAVSDRATRLLGAGYVDIIVYLQAAAAELGGAEQAIERAREADR